MDIGFGRRGRIGPGALVVGILDGGGLTEAAAAADKATRGAVKRAVAMSRFKGQAGRSLELLAPAGVKASRIVLAGLGKGEAFDSNAAERLAATVMGRLLTGGEEKVTFAIDLPKQAKIAEAELAAHLGFGALLRSYSFDSYRKVSDDEKPTVKNVVVATAAAAAAKKLWAELAALGEGMFLARDLVNEPPNVLYPDEFAKRTQALRKLGVKVEVFDVPAMRKLGMNALLGVGQGSAHDSRMVVMRWNGAPKDAAGRHGPLAFIGKGVCFDSGGLSLKTGAGMMGMKGDMGGAAAVVGLIHALATRKARVNAVGADRRGREHAGRQCPAAQRHRQNHVGPDHRSPEHGRGGAPRACRRAVVRAIAAQAEIHGRSGDADRRRRGGARLRACRPFQQQ